MPNPEELQSELDFGQGNSAGYARWRSEQAAWLAKIRRESELPVGQPVRVKLRDFDREIRGRLGLVELSLQSISPSRALVPRRLIQVRCERNRILRPGRLTRTSHRSAVGRGSGLGGERW